FKAALCYGFAIALRALFLGILLLLCWGILCLLIASLALTMTQPNVIASKQHASVATKILG
ncbi:MAG: hypothetical protein K2F85_09140, partial [Helicobacter sp.]|nr:hypothetical protein [Helicobacter sp.]